MNDKSTPQATCCATIFGERGWRHQCNKKAKVQRDSGLYCGIHDPVAVEQKRKARDEAWAKKYAAERAAAEEIYKQKAQQKFRAECFPDLLEALQLCEQVLSDLGSTQLKGTRTRASWEKCRAAIAKATK